MAERGYQRDFSELPAGQYDRESREAKARTMVAVLREASERPLHKLRLLNIGGSSGFVDNYLANHFQRVTGADIDVGALRRGASAFEKPNLAFHAADAMAMPYANASFDVVVCSQVYEHVPDARKMMREIFRTLKRGGLCYFAASNRLMWNEPHYNLPLLSVVPRPLAHLYVRLAGRGQHYHELHFSYWGLKRLVRDFACHDYTQQMLEDPQRYGIEYMVPVGSHKARVARWIARYAPWLVPGYIWVLRKPLQP